MTDRTRREHEAAALLMAAVVGDASSDDLVKLNNWLREDASLAKFVVDLMNQESWLSWHAATPATTERLATILKSAGTTRLDEAPSSASRFSYALAASLLLAIGALLGVIGSRWRDRPAGDRPVIALGAQAESESSARYVARFVQGTACLWNPETASSLEPKGALRKGESLNLLEGLAEFQFEWSTGAANIKLEGPAGIVLTAERGANLSRGKVTADVQVAGGVFVLGTPHGQVEVSENASIGVAVRGDAVELHVFRGTATLVAPWAGVALGTERLQVASGSSLTIANDAEGWVREDRGVAQPAMFVSQISMGSDGLVIPTGYAEEVLRGKPALYWRFEGADPTTVRNEAGPRFVGRIQGAMKWNNEGENGNVELGAGLTPEALHAYIISDDRVTEDFSKGYTVEAWIKPSHYHWGTIVGLIGDPMSPKGDSVHGVLFELGGPISYPSSIEHPGRFRFLHRSPPSSDLNTGTSCFSPQPYELRKWQHVAIVKDGPAMRLYVNGEVVASGEDSTSLPAGLRLIVGQLDERRLERRFTGQIDELAVYPRALSEAEIQRRYDLVRNPPTVTPVKSKRAI